MLSFGIGGVVGVFMLLVLAVIVAFVILIFTSNDNSTPRELNLTGAAAGEQGIGGIVFDAED